MTPYFECRSLWRQFGALTAVADVSISVEAGETRAIIGPNGAGKSSLFNLITGFLKPTSGEVMFKGERLTGLAPEAIAQRGVARTFQITAIFPNLTVLENLRLAVQARERRRWLFVGGGRVLGHTRERARSLLGEFRLADLAELPAKLLSHGDQRLLEIAMGMAQGSEILLLDEPTQGLSIDETARMVELLKAVLRTGTTTVLLVEHDMEVVFSLADRITVLQQGRVIADGAPDRVRNDAAVQAAYLGGVE
ncbi:MAG: ABC transporter ATP-binding protein [Alphaproteobacteria bacterium]|nr:ABC transporter ATP-binding protein [Alphaproteobacteria bacterium]